MGFFILLFFFFGAESLETAMNKVLFDFFTFPSIKMDNRVVKFGQ